MKARIQPGTINGTIHVPPSKSITQRAYAAALLFAGSTLIKNAGHSADEDAALNIIRQLGATLTQGADLTITSQGINPIWTFKGIIQISATVKPMVNGLGYGSG